jgi:hypothetical protein
LLRLLLLLLLLCCPRLYLLLLLLLLRCAVSTCGILHLHQPASLLLLLLHLLRLLLWRHLLSRSLLAALATVTVAAGWAAGCLGMCGGCNSFLSSWFAPEHIRTIEEGRTRAGMVSKTCGGCLSWRPRPGMSVRMR